MTGLVLSSMIEAAKVSPSKKGSSPPFRSEFGPAKLGLRKSHVFRSPPAQRVVIDVGFAG